MTVYEIRPYEPRHAAVWRSLNEAWLAEGGFAIEPSDVKVLDDPQGCIIDRGGAIFIAEQVSSDGEGQAVGCCGLIPMDDGGMEIAKMTVSPQARGAKLSLRLLQACEAEARARGARRLYLETSSTLLPALSLYRRFGFVDLPAQSSPYARADVWMERPL